ncbi:RNA-directed DNA polymerase from mobile element jockey [Araneus ventricosus]|uniref:RNA-directed DNA polymerase from mobile element jockey n=1 Tax=Araneus ventricosus TaxID=182803 RepID=A0A4Y2V615_ARAVE|nr:RNA-directed DNA polymerase from mobile element jockey [Araneus ventricosus]
MLQETKLRPQGKFFLANYSIYYSYRENQNQFQPSGGTAIAIKNNIPHYHLIPPTLHYVEATVVVINLKNCEPVNLVSMYVPPSAELGMFTFDIENLIQLGTYQIICGDFNAHHTTWNCSSISPRGITLRNFVDQVGLEILHPDSPTRYGSYSASTIDLTLIKNFLFPYEIHSIPEMSSDHNPVMVCFFLKYQLPDTKGNSKINWNRYRDNIRKYCDINICNLNSADKIDNLADNIENIIINAKNASLIPIKNKPQVIDAEIRKLNNERNYARRNFQRTRNPAHRSVMNRLNKQIRKLSEKLEQDRLQNRLLNVNTYDGKIWNVVKPYKKKAQTIPSLHDQSNIALTDTDKANFLANSLETQFSLNNLSDRDTENIVNHSVGRFRSMDIKYEGNDLPLPSEIMSCIKKLKPNKAPGIDNISNKMIQNLPTNVIILFTFLIRKMLQYGHFPSRWKTATVVPILKPGKDPTQPSSYRPISLLSSLSKIAEHVILKRLIESLSDNNILCPEQFGFRPNLSTSHQLVRVTEFITEGFANKQKTGAVFLDIQKAFDRVWQDALIHKLIGFNIPNYLVKLIDSYLANRSFRVRVKNELSDLKTIKAGVAQGSKIGPILFSCFINDIPKQCNTMLCMYADDTAILTRNKNPNYIQPALNRHIKALEVWFMKWKIAINASKTEAIMFHKSTTYGNFPQLKIHNETITWSKQSKYLGVILDSRLTWKPHFLYVRQKFWAQARKLYPLIARNSKMDREAKLLIYTAYLRPVITYACPTWGYAAKTNLKILETLQNNIIRQITNATWYMTNTDIRYAIKYPSLKEFIKKLATSFFKNLDIHDNPAIQEINKYLPDPKINRPRNVLLL